MQNNDGQFSEYGPGKWNLPATAFATKFMGQTLTLLNTGPPIDPTLIRHVVEADRKAIVVVLTDDELYEHGRKYSNQYTNVWSGALAYLKLYPDEEIERLLRSKIIESVPEFQSPAGYFYEKNGPDRSYNLRTHQTNLAAARHFTDDAELMSIWDEKDRHFYDWLSYNAVLEPDHSGFYMNRAIETRQRVVYLGREPRGLFSHVTPPGKRLESASPFCVTHEEREERLRQGRADLNANWPAVAPLKAFEPYHFLSRDFDLGLPSLSQRERATAKLPYLARERFTHQRVDNRLAASFTYIRRPSYYAAFNAGEVPSGVSQTRLGLGLLWSPAMGCLLQSQTGSFDAAWGTQAAGQKQVYEADSLAVTFAVGERTLQPTPGVRDVPDGPFEVTYALGTHGAKTVRFEEDAICVHVQHPGGFTEILPLLCNEEDSVTVGEKQVELKTPCGALKVLFSEKATAQLEKTQQSDWLKSVRVVQLHAQDELTYKLRLASRPPADEG